jgi:hypothetical protein
VPPLHLFFGERQVGSARLSQKQLGFISTQSAVHKRSED